MLFFKEEEDLFVLNFLFLNQETNILGISSDAANGAECQVIKFFSNLFIFLHLTSWSNSLTDFYMCAILWSSWFQDFYISALCSIMALAIISCNAKSIIITWCIILFPPRQCVNLSQPTDATFSPSSPVPPSVIYSPGW